MIRVKKCAFCQFYNPTSSVTGECRRTSPGAQGFPPTEKETWCGDFDPIHQYDARLSDEERFILGAWHLRRWGGSGLLAEAPTHVHPRQVADYQKQEEERATREGRSKVW